MKRAGPKDQISITLDKAILEYLDKQAVRLHIPRSRLIENCILLAVDDMKLLEKLGLIDAAMIIRKVQDRLKKELKAVTA